MLTFTAAILILILGYLVYGRVVERVFGIQKDRPTPAVTMPDGVDYVPFPWRRAFLIQFLNIAGLGPIFGAIAGALWGPVAFLWIVLGALFAGATHDFLSGMMSVRHSGETLGEMVGRYLGRPAMQAVRLFTVILMLLVGAVFITGPADLLASMTGWSKTPFLLAIIVYYILATLLPIDKLIGRIYPLFGAALLFMGGAILFGILHGGYVLPELTLKNLHPQGTAIFPFLFITIACGAISGFHATQSPLMARCLRSEREGRRVFYGAMITESIVAMIWAAAAMAFFGSTGALKDAGSAAVVVKTMSTTLLGHLGGLLAIFGVVAAPITSGDTAFRSARLIVADALKRNQKRYRDRFMIALPLFAIGITICFLDFTIIWRYFAWANQTLGAVVLWTAAVYLRHRGRFHWLASLPAAFMTSVVVSYILVAPEGFHVPARPAITAGTLAALTGLVLFLFKKNPRLPESPKTRPQA